MSPKLIPDEALEGLSRGVVTALWIVGALVVGAIAVVVVAAVAFASDSVGFGVWGAVAVVAVALLAGAVSWRRHRPESGTRVADAGGGSPRRGPAPGAARVERAPSIPAALRGDSADDRPADAPAARVVPPPPEPAARPGASAPSKQDYHRALDEGRLGDAEAVVRALRDAGEAEAWCANAERRIAHARSRG